MNNDSSKSNFEAGSSTETKSHLVLHLSWVIFVLTLIIATILMLRLSDDQDMVNILSIGGSIASIILAIVSIIYAFLQNKSASILSTQMISTLTGLDAKVDNIEIRVNGYSFVTKEPSSQKKHLDFSRIHGIYSTSSKLNTDQFVSNIKDNLIKYSPNTSLIDYSVYNLHKSVDDHFRFSTSVSLFFSGRLDEELRELIINNSLPVSHRKVEFNN